jgi:YjbR
MTKQQILATVRELCLALPETSERPSHGEPTFFVGGKRSFATVWDSHHGDGRLALICAAPPGMQSALVEAEPERFYVPPYVGHRGWLGSGSTAVSTAKRSPGSSRMPTPRSRHRDSFRPIDREPEVGLEPTAT